MVRSWYEASSLLWLVLQSLGWVRLTVLRGWLQRRHFLLLRERCPLSIGLCLQLAVSSSVTTLVHPNTPRLTHLSMNVIFGGCLAEEDKGLQLTRLGHIRLFTLNVLLWANIHQQLFLVIAALCVLSPVRGGWPIVLTHREEVFRFGRFHFGLDDRYRAL